MLKIIFINVGYGDAILVESTSPQSSYTVLIDGGTDETVYEFLKLKNMDKIDLMICTHFHADHVCGLVKVAENMEIGEFWAPTEIDELVFDDALTENPDDSMERFLKGLIGYQRLYDIVLEKEIPTKSWIGDFEYFFLPSDLMLEILGPAAFRRDMTKDFLTKIKASTNLEEAASIMRDFDAWLNQSSIILKFHKYGESILLMGDADRNTVEYLYDTPEKLASTLVKIGHHGQADAVDSKLVRAIAPKVVITCVSQDRRYRSAHDTVYQTFRDNNPPNSPEIIFGFTDKLELLDKVTPQSHLETKLGYEVIFNADASIQARDIFGTIK